MVLSWPAAMYGLDAVSRTLASDGFVHVGGDFVRAQLSRNALAGLADFGRSWDRLGEDRYMADGGRYRRRRHGAFAVGSGAVERKVHQAHFQSRDHNALNGGIERWFEPIEDAVADSSPLHELMALGDRIFRPLASGAPALWHVEAHQFRIEANSNALGFPTPEGLHRDGVDWVLVALIDRHNVEQGETKIHARNLEEVGAFSLKQALEVVLVDDQRVYHAVTPIVPIDASRAAHRDVLVVTYSR